MGTTLGDAATVEGWAFVAEWAFVACWTGAEALGGRPGLPERRLVAVRDCRRGACQERSPSSRWKKDPRGSSRLMPLEMVQESSKVPPLEMLPPLRDGAARGSSSRGGRHDRGDGATSGRLSVTAMS